jgi:hypothetical protein
VIIPVGFAQATYVFSSGFLPFGAVITHGISDNLLKTPDEIAEDLYQAFSDNMLGSLHTSVNFDTVRIKRGPNSTGATGEFTGVLTGGQGGTAAPPNLAYLIEKNTGLGGRRGRGRLFLPGVEEGSVEGDGALGAVMLGGLITQSGLWLADIETAGYNMVLLHSDATAPTEVTSLSVDPRAATQRNRMRR